MVKMFDSGQGFQSMKAMKKDDKAFKSSSQRVFREKEEKHKNKTVNFLFIFCISKVIYGCVCMP